MRKTLITLTALAALVGAGVTGHAEAAGLAPSANPLVRTVQYYGGQVQYYGNGYGEGYGDWRREREWRHRDWERRREQERWHYERRHG